MQSAGVITGGDKLARKIGRDGSEDEKNKYEDYTKVRIFMRL